MQFYSNYWESKVCFSTCTAIFATLGECIYKTNNIWNINVLSFTLKHSTSFINQYKSYKVNMYFFYWYEYSNILQENCIIACIARGIMHAWSAKKGDFLCIYRFTDFIIISDIIMWKLYLCRFHFLNARFFSNSKAIKYI